MHFVRNVDLSALIEKQPVRTLAELQDAGVPAHVVRYAVEQGQLYRLFRGVVCNSTIAIEQGVDEVAIHLLTGGIVWGLSAGQRHEISDAMPNKLELLVPHESSRAPAGLPVLFTRTRNPENLVAGVEQRETEFGMSYPMTDEARTIVDLYRVPAHRQHARDALMTYLARGGPPDAVGEYARKFGQWDKVGPHIEMAWEMQERGMKP